MLIPITRTTTVADPFDRLPERGPLGRFRPERMVDLKGRPLVVIDLLEVERRLKARTQENKDE